MAYEIKSIVDSEHYREYIKENDMLNNNQSKYDYLDYVNATPELYEKYVDEDRAKRESNLAVNLGSNWREIYDIETGEYINGNTPDNLTEGRIGIMMETGHDIGENADIYPEYTSVYSRLDSERSNLLSSQYNQAVKDLKSASTQAARDAYVQKMTSADKLPEQIAALGAGGITQTSLLALETEYMRAISEIENAHNEQQSEIDELYLQEKEIIDTEAAQEYINSQNSIIKQQQDIQSELSKIANTYNTKKTITPSTTINQSTTSTKSASAQAGKFKAPSYSTLSDIDEEEAKRVIGK